MSDNSIIDEIETLVPKPIQSLVYFSFGLLIIQFAEAVTVPILYFATFPFEMTIIQEMVTTDYGQHVPTYGGLVLIFEVALVFLFYLVLCMSYWEKFKTLNSVIVLGRISCLYALALISLLWFVYGFWVGSGLQGVLVELI